MTTKVLKVDLPAEIFDVAVNIPLIHQVVVAQQAAARQGTHSTKTRGEVRGGGRKPYKQKGTGRARQGSTRSPQFAGGGVVHGPQPRDYSQRTPKKMKAAALRGALSDRARDGRIHVVDSLVSGEKPSTRSALKALTGVVERRKFLLVLERSDAVTWLSLRNAPEVHIVAVDQLNTYDVLAADDVVFTQGAYDAFVGGDTAGADVVETIEVETTIGGRRAGRPGRRRRPRSPRRPTSPRRPSCPRAPRPRSRAAALPRASRSRATPTPASTTSPTASGTTRPTPSSTSRPPRTPRPLASRVPVAADASRRGGVQVSTLHKDHRDVLIAPVVSEKSYGLLDANKYTFLVRPDANKTEIKIAVEKVFNVKVTSVNTINRAGKTRRTRTGLGKRKDTKRAIVSLAEGHRIDIFGGPVS